MINEFNQWEQPQDNSKRHQRSSLNPCVHRFLRCYHMQRVLAVAAGDARAARPKEFEAAYSSEIHQRLSEMKVKTVRLEASPDILAEFFYAVVDRNLAVRQMA